MERSYQESDVVLTVDEPMDVEIVKEPVAIPSDVSTETSKQARLVHNYFNALFVVHFMCLFIRLSTHITFFFRAIRSPPRSEGARTPILPMLSLHASLVTHTARAYPGFRSIKRLGVLLLLLDAGMLVHRRLPPTYVKKV